MDPNKSMFVLYFHLTVCFCIFKVNTKFSNQAKTGISSPVTIVGMVTVSSSIACAIECTTFVANDTCCTASYSSITKHCRLDSCHPPTEYSESDVVLRKTEDECKKTDLGRGYKGLLNVTINGRQCQHWNVDYPHKHWYFIPCDQANYCRNVDSTTGGPWCYTVDPSMRWEFCDIQYCDICILIYCMPLN